MPVEQVYEWLGKMPNDSIYDSSRLAQPDEVANYHTGDGMEKAFLLANVIHERKPEQDMEVIADKNNVILKGPSEYRFISTKGLKKTIRIAAAEVIRIIE